MRIEALKLVRINVSLVFEKGKYCINASVKIQPPRYSLFLDYCMFDL